MQNKKLSFLVKCDKDREFESDRIFFTFKSNNTNEKERVEC